MKSQNEDKHRLSFWAALLIKGQGAVTDVLLVFTDSPQSCVISCMSALSACYTWIFTDTKLIPNTTQ